MGEGVITAEDCAKKWKTIRDRFVREAKKAKAKKSGESGPSFVSSWPLYEVMSFVGDTVKHRQ